MTFPVERNNTLVRWFNNQRPQWALLPSLFGATMIRYSLVCVPWLRLCWSVKICLSLPRFRQVGTKIFSSRLFGHLNSVPASMWFLGLTMRAAIWITIRLSFRQWQLGLNQTSQFVWCIDWNHKWWSGFVPKSYNQSIRSDRWSILRSDQVRIGQSDHLGVSV